MLRRISAVLCLTGALAAGSATAAPSSAGQSACGGATRGLKTVSLRKAGFRIGVPRSWTAMSGDAYGHALDAAIAKDPSLAAYRDALKDPYSPLKLFALTCEPGHAYPSTLSVIVQGTKRGFAFADFERGTINALGADALPGHAPKAAPFPTRAGRAVRIRTVLRAPGAKVPLAMTIYLVQTRKVAYMITYATVRELNARYAPLFDASVRSLREL